MSVLDNGAPYGDAPLPLPEGGDPPLRECSGGDEHNLTIESRYAGRIRRTA